MSATPSSSSAPRDGRVDRRLAGDRRGAAYRVVAADGASAEDFRGLRGFPRRRALPIDTPWVLLAGVSMFGTSEASLQIARCPPAGVAHVRLEVGRGIHFARTGRPGHYTVWGAPTVLVDSAEHLDRAS